MVELQWIRYENKYMMFLNLGTYNDMYIGFDATHISDGSINMVRKNIELLRRMGVKERVNWIRDLGEKSIRTLKKGKMRIVNTFPISSEGEQPD
jgi:hypothetical protein